MKSMEEKYYAIEMSNGYAYGIPVEVIAESYARYYSAMGLQSYVKAYNEMISEFDKNGYGVEDWARRNMDWDDVKDSAKILYVKNPSEIDFQNDWVNGRCKYVVRKKTYADGFPILK